MKRIWTIEEIKNLLEKSDIMVQKSLLKLYEQQTESEKMSETTRINNRVGFNAFDAEILSSFSKQLLTRNFLSKKQIDFTRKKLYKYARQLTALANI